MAVGLSDPFVCYGTTGPARTDAYVTTPAGGPSCRLQAAPNSPVTVDVLAGRGANPSLSAVGRFAGSNDSPELPSSLTLHLLTS